MDFKYKNQHLLLSCDCPPTEQLKAINQKAFRIVHGDITHANNFKPPLIISPNRLETFESCEERCEYYALSFFTDEKKAEKFINKLISHRPLIRTLIGDSIAVGMIEECEGLADVPKGGHFNFHEYEVADFQSKFTIIKEV